MNIKVVPLPPPRILRHQLRYGLLFKYADELSGATFLSATHPFEIEKTLRDIDLETGIIYGVPNSQSSSPVVIIGEIKFS